MYEQHKICNTSYNRFKLHVFLQLPDCQFPNKTNVKRNTKTDVNFICMRNIILPLINCLCYVVLKMRCFKNQKNWDINKSPKMRHQQKPKQLGHQQKLKAFQKCFSSLCSAMWPDEFDLTKGVTTLWLRMVAPIIIQSSECCNRDIEQVIDYRQWGVMTLFFK